jgi:tetratricopeptide (TPR) repeat protein
VTRKSLAAALLMTAASLSAHAAGQNPEAASGVGQYANFDQTMSHQRGSVYFQGKVAVVGGELPWDAVPVVVNCSGVTRYDTRTDTKGIFKIEAAPVKSEVAEIKSESNRPTPTELTGCEVSARLQGFTSSKLTIINGSLMDNPDIGTIMLHVDEHSTGSSVSPTTAAAPKDALKSFDKARAEAQSGHPDSAQHDLEKAVKIDPQFAEAWYQLGKIEAAARPQDAMEAFAKAQAADPNFIPAFERAAVLAATQKNWQVVVDATDHALKLDPAGTPLLWYLNASGNYNLGHAGVAESSARRSLAMDPSHEAPNTEQLLAVILAGRHDYPGALEHLRNCLTYMPPGPSADVIKQQVAKLEKIVTKASN